MSTRFLVLVLFDGVRSAEPRISSGIGDGDRLPAPARSPCGSRSSASRRRACPSARRSPSPSAAGRLRARRRSNSPRLCGDRSREALLPARRAPACRARRRRASRRGCRSGISNGAVFPVERSSARRRSLPRRAARRAPSTVPAFFGAPKPMVVLQAISVGRSDFSAASIAAAIASGSWPSTRDGVPAGRLEARHLIDGVGTASAARRSRCRCRRRGRSAC